MKKAFEQTPYKDDLGVLQHFEKHIDDCADKWKGAQHDVYYAPYTVLFQGSGTGKSRLLYQLAQNRFVLYLCFRERSSSGVPPATELFRNYFLIGKGNAMVNAAAFFYSCVEFLDGKSIEDWNRQQQSDKFESDIITRASHLVEQWKDSLNQVENQEAMEWFCTKEIAGVWRKVETYLSNTVKTKAKLVFAFDESRSLLQISSLPPGENTQFIHIRRALRCLPSGIFAIFADTISNLTNFAPSASLDPSARLYLLQNELFPPFYFMATFDLFTKTNSSSNQLLSLQELFSLGRPLWGAALNNDANIKELLKLAEQKLLGGGITVDNWLKKPTFSSALAVLSSRISLDVTAESRIASELVSGFMGICVHVSEDRCRLLVFYPSEPIVAEAAASLMRHENVFRKLLNFLLDALHTGYVEPGYRGELVARLLLMIAWDQATGSRGLSSSLNLENLGYMKEFVSQPIRVKDFLTSLFGQDNYNNNIQDLPQKFTDGLLAFTHFIPLTYTPTQIELRSLFIRFAAVICKRNQAGVDLILPVLLDWDGSNTISLNSMSYFLIQIKNWNQFYDDDWPASATSKLSKEYVFKGSSITEEKSNPYLSLYLQLGAPIPELRPLHVDNLPSSNTRSKKRARLEGYGEQYCLSAFGLDKSVYHCLDKWSDNDIDILKQLLHAWPDPVNLTTHEDVKLLIQSMMPLVYQEDRASKA